MPLTRPVIGLAFAVMAGACLHFAGSAPAEEADGNGAALVGVVLPDALSDEAETGGRLFDAKCASCHGENAAGRAGTGPPLVHIVYEPGHHGDESFQRAVALGVRSHHWPFGDMAPVEGLSRADVALIVVYVRELQRANGID